ncbi:uncharacterized protein LOC144660948 [Oculina patagonica]
MITTSCFYALLIWSVTVVSVVSDCPPGKKTDNAEGRCCVFPFVYGGVSYDSCTDQWCSLTAVYSGQWAYCVNPCTNNPCQNAGTCTVTGDDSYSCQCAEGYYGNSCEKGRPCPPGKKTDNAEGRCCVFPFVYGGVSYDSCTDQWCSLTAVYSGQWANCVNPCTNNPCQNAGTCTVTGDDSYSCQCAEGYYGNSCEKVSPCNSSPCKNGASCIMTGEDSYSCNCTEEFEGETCESRRPCPPGKKTDNAEGRCCVFPFVYGGVSYDSCTDQWCSLTAVYSGQWAYCVNPCTNNPCQNAGTCTVTGDDSYSCQCAEGYYGNSCEKVSPCNSSPCKNGASCIMTGEDSYSCNCTEEFEGETCESRRPCPPGKKTDNAEGRCCVFPFVYGGVSYDSCTDQWCSLTAVYSGQWAYCVNPCTNNPCQNAGTCTVTGDDSYSCQCAEGYYGNSCEKGRPCPPGKKTDNAEGRCCVFPFVYGGVSYDSCTDQWCSLTAVYSGQWAYCVNPCTNNPCQNAGTCTVTGDDSYSCQCAEGYYGNSCEKVSPCNSSPCKNGASCIMTGEDSYSCNCTEEFEGETCESRRPCPPGKKTDNAEGRCCVFPFVYGGVSYDSCTDQWCSLTAVYSGQWAYCVNPCTNNPCQNAGTCTVTGDDSYSCQCAEGYYGNSCEKGRPCPPGKKTDNAEGRCCVFPFVYGGVSYDSCTDQWCSLTAVYSGQWAYCVNPCTNNPCQNAGTCTVTGDDSYSCQCAEGYYGNSCEKGRPCPPGKKTDNAEGRCCVFPFVYGGVSYDSCTDQWCSLTAVYSGQWAYCVNPCTNNPCQNAGTCTVTGDDSYSCQCAEGYYGNSCEKVSPCNSSPCKNGASCIMTGEDSYSCNCTEEFEGETCESRRPCPPGKKTDNAEGRCCVFPFVYGGVSYDSCTDQWCSLTAVYSGQWAYCVNPCTNNPCQNAGTCTVTGDDSYSCQCAEGYYGNSCEKVSPCNSSPCKNGASCIMTGEDSYSCNCTEEFEGETCESRRPCPPGKKTDNAEGRCCVFPFVYGGVSYDSCTDQWCSLTAVYSGQWANCVNPCTNNPCQNAGTCTVTGDDSYSCQCSEGYYGNSCEKGRPCPPGKKTDNAEGRCCVFPFVYGGVSYDSCTDQWCSLTAVYSGQWAYCVNPCTNNPCQNAGTCTVTGDDSYSCQCAEGYYGNSCEKVSPCNSSPCKNGASCIMTGEDSYSCNCTEEFEGETCESRRPCPPGKKTDNAEGRCCVFPFVYGGVSYDSCTDQWCSLTAVYSGQWAYCVNPCTNNPCQNAGTCTVTGDDSYSCQCAEGYYGNSCEKVSPCNSSPCKNGASCIMTGEDSYSCNCTEEFEGETCESRRPCPPGKKTDNAEGRCCVFPFVYGGVSYDSCTDQWCSLTAVYSGQWAYCVNPCTNNPCQNAGTCTVTGDDSYSCQCAEGYYGNSCEKGRPCPPGKKTDNAEGRCCVFPFVYGGVSYDSCTDQWCSLTAVYSGQWAYCVNPCTNNPCQNAGTCTVTGDDSYSCQCAEGYYGNSCEKVSPCNSSPCKNGASCIMTGEDSYSCNCTEEFEGETCESRRPCPPGKKTDNAEGRCCVFPFVYGGVSYDSCTDQWCSLTAVYSGQWANCVDECASSPCKNGASCKTTEDGYSCQPCPAGWKGINCDEDINECEASPCKNGATCENQPGGYSCSCMSGYTGQNCEQDINECANDPCLNGATCHDEVGRYTCECPAGYEGTNCETDIDECEVDPYV